MQAAMRKFILGVGWPTSALIHHDLAHILYQQHQMKLIERRGCEAKLFVECLCLSVFRMNNQRSQYVSTLDSHRWAGAIANACCIESQIWLGAFNKQGGLAPIRRQSLPSPKARIRMFLRITFFVSKLYCLARIILMGLVSGLAAIFARKFLASAC